MEIIFIGDTNCLCLTSTFSRNRDTLELLTFTAGLTSDDMGAKLFLITTPLHNLKQLILFVCTV